MAVHSYSSPPEPEFTPDEELLHTGAHPFCSDMTCPCHEDRELIESTNQFVQEGLLSPEDADRVFRGRMLCVPVREGEQKGTNMNGKYTGEYTQVVLESVASGQRTIADVVELKRLYEHLVNDYHKNLDKPYYTRSCASLTMNTTYSRKKTLR